MCIFGADASSNLVLTYIGNQVCIIADKALTKAQKPKKAKELRKLVSLDLEYNGHKRTLITIGKKEKGGGSFLPKELS